MRCGAMPARSRTPRSSCRCPTRRSHLPSAPSGSSNTTRSHRCVSAGSSTEGRPARISALQLRPVRKVAYLPAMAQRSRFRFLAAIAVSSLVVAACGSDDDDGGTNDDSGGTDTVDSGDPATTEDEGADAAAGSVDELVIAIGGDETSLNPYTYVTGYPGWNLLGLIHDSLLVLDETNTARPLLATDWTTSDDGLVWTTSRSSCNRAGRQVSPLSTTSRCCRRPRWRSPSPPPARTSPSARSPTCRSWPSTCGPMSTTPTTRGSSRTSAQAPTSSPTTPSTSRTDSRPTPTTPWGPRWPRPCCSR